MVVHYLVLIVDVNHLFGKIPFMTQTDSMTNLTMGAGFFILLTWAVLVSSHCFDLRRMTDDDIERRYVLLPLAKKNGEDFDAKNIRILLS